MTNEENRNLTVMKRLFEELWNDKNENIAFEIISDNFISRYEHETFTGAKIWLERFYKPLITAVPNLHVTVNEMLACGDVVNSRWIARGIHAGELLGVKGTNTHIEFSGISWTKLSNGKLVENWNSWNMSFLVRRLLDELNTLKEIVPICSYCKKIRDDEGIWEIVEAFISKNPNIALSHGVCPDCLTKLKEDMDL